MEHFSGYSHSFFPVVPFLNMNLKTEVPRDLCAYRLLFSMLKNVERLTGSKIGFCRASCSATRNRTKLSMFFSELAWVKCASCTWGQPRKKEKKKGPRQMEERQKHNGRCDTNIYWNCLFLGTCSFVKLWNLYTNAFFFCSSTLCPHKTFKYHYVTSRLCTLEHDASTGRKYGRGENCFVMFTEWSFFGREIRHWIKTCAVRASICYCRTGAPVSSAPKRKK